jgi:cysteine dioxygenase
MNQHKTSMDMHLPRSLKHLVATIQERSPTNNNEIATLVKQHPIDRDELLPYNNFEHPVHESYGRRQLYADDNFCIYLMSWCPGDFTAIHDHGTTQWGCVLALDDFTHRVYQFTNNKLTIKAKEPFLRGQIAGVKNDVIHLMGNSSHQYALSLHIYGTNDPGLKQARGSRIFYPEINQMTITGGAAYLYHAQNTLGELYDFDAIDNETLQDYLAILSLHKTTSIPYKVV